MQIKSIDYYKPTRILHYIEALFEYFIYILCSGAFFAKLTTTIGISDSTTALLASLTSLATGVQIFSIYMSKRTPVRRWIIPMQGIANLGFVVLYLMPLFKLGAEINEILFFVILLSVRTFLSLLSPCKVVWFENIVDDRIRGANQAWICIVSYAGSIVITYAAGAMLEYYESINDMNTAFIVIAAAILTLNLLLVGTLLMCKEKTVEIERKESVIDSIKSVFSKRAFRAVIILSIMISFFVNLSEPFYSTYQLKELNFSMTFIATINMIRSGLSIVLLYAFGRLSTKIKYTTIFGIYLLLSILPHIFMCFCTPSNGHAFFMLYTVFSCLAGAPSTVATVPILLAVTPIGDRTAAVTMKSMILGIVIFLSTLVGGRILDYIQGQGNRIMGMNIYAQQLLSLLSVLGLILTMIYYFTYCKNTVETESL